VAKTRSLFKKKYPRSSTRTNSTKHKKSYYSSVVVNCMPDTNKVEETSVFRFVHIKDWEELRIQGYFLDFQTVEKTSGEET
jgi:hypothetical protein